MRRTSLVWPALALVAVWAVATTKGPFANVRVNDLFVYRTYAGLMVDGQLPYRDFGFEYPPIAALPLWLAGLLAGGHGFGEDAYGTWFGLLMGGCALAGQQLAARIVGGRPGLMVAWLLALAPIAIGAQVRTHFDVLPVALLLGGLLAFSRERTDLGFALLGAGAMTKLFPALLVPIAVVWLLAQGRRTQAWRGAAIAVAVAAAIALPFAGQGFVDQFTFHLDRPIQIESTPATVLFAVGGSEVTGTNLRPDRFKSNGLDGGAAGVVQPLFAVLLVLALAGVIALAGRDPGVRHLGLCCFAALLAFVALGKVLSPQYVIWLAPFAALAWAWRARAAALACGAAIVLTQVEFPSRYFDLINEDHAVIAIVAVRNAALLAAFALVVMELVRRPARAAARSPWRPWSPGRSARARP